MRRRRAERSLAELVDEFRTNRRDEERIRSESPIARAELGGGGDGRVAGWFVDPFLVEHHVEHGVPPLRGDFQAFVGVVAIGRADHTGDQRRLGRSELLWRLGEIHAGGFAESADFAPVAVAEVDLVEVGLEDLVLGEVDLDDDGVRHLGDLAREGTVVGEEGVARELLGDRASAFGDAAGADVGDEGASDADGVDADVAAEALVFGGEESVGDVARQLAEGDRIGDAPFGSVEGDEGFAVAVEDFGGRAPGAGGQLGVDAVGVPAERGEERDRDDGHDRECDCQTGTGAEFLELWVHLAVEKGKKGARAPSGDVRILWLWASLPKRLARAFQPGAQVFCGGQYLLA